jgi:hypothetical protein
MNSRLVAVQRPDKTGKVVTRHIKADPSTTTARSIMPAPSLGPQPKASKLAPVKPRPKQVERQRKTGVWGGMDERLGTTGVISKSHYYALTVSEAEVYEVLAVTAVYGNAIKLLSEGVRSSEEARNYLTRYGLDDIIKDRSELTQEALRKNVSPDDFVMYGRMINPRHDPSNAMDAVLFAASPLAEGNFEAQSDILEGNISYADIKRIGVSKLKASGRLGEILPLLRQLQKGDTPCTVDDLKELVDKCSSQRVESRNLRPVVDFIQDGGIETVRRTSDLLRITVAYSETRWNHQKGKLKHDPFEQADYAIRVTNGVAERPDSGIRGASIYVIDEYIDAGIPVDIAIEVMSNKGDITEAILLNDARNKGINSNLDEGWL